MKNAERQLPHAEEIKNSGFKSYLGWQLYLGIILISLGVTLGLLMEIKPDIWGKIVVAVIAEVGFAFVIAHVIIVVVDRREKQAFSSYVKDEHRKTKAELELAQKRLASRGILAHLLGTDIPASMSDELEDYILSSKIIKRSQKVTFEIRPIGKYTSLVVEAEATYENNRDDPYDWEPPYQSFGEEFLSDYFKTNLPNEKFGLMTYIIRLKRSSQLESTLYDSSVHEGPASRLQKSYRMLPGDQVLVIVSERKSRFGMDNEIFTSFSFCEKMEIFLRYSVSEYDVDYRAVHPKSNVMREESHISGKKLVLDVPFMPGNGIIVWWRRCATLPVASTAPRGSSDV